MCFLTSCHHGRSRFKDGEVSSTEDGKHFLFIPEASDGGLYEAQVSGHHDLWRPADNNGGGGKADGDRWLVAEVFDIINSDWQTWFGTLCVLLWLLYLIVL